MTPCCCLLHLPNRHLHSNSYPRDCFGGDSNNRNQKIRPLEKNNHVTPNALLIPTLQGFCLVLLALYRIYPRWWQELHSIVLLSLFRQCLGCRTQRCCLIGLSQWCWFLLVLLPLLLPLTEWNFLTKCSLSLSYYYSHKMNLKIPVII